MNHNIITTSSMIHNRDKQYQQRLSAAPATRKHHFLGTLQVLLTAITMLFSLGVQGAWAETTVLWNFSDDGWAAGTAKNGLTPGSGVTFDANSKSIDGYSFTNRLKLGGAMSEAINVSFTVTGACKIKVYGMSGKANTTRTLKINSGSNDGNAVTTGFASNDGNSIGGYEYNYTGGATTLFIGSENSGYNLYAIKVTYADAPTSNWRDIKLDFTGESSFIRSQADIAAKIAASQDPAWTAFNTGVAIAEDGTPSCVAVDAQDSRVTLNAKYHGTDYGIQPNTTFVVPVEGPVTITYGMSNASGTVTISDTNGKLTDLSINFAGGRWTPEPAYRDRVATYTYKGGPTTLTCSGGDYVPYFAVEKYDGPLTADYTVTFANETADVAGNVPSAVTKGENETMKIPTNTFMYKEGYTLVGWSDGVNTYKAGDNYTFTKDEALTAVFEKNAFELDERTAEAVVNWDLSQTSGLNISTGSFYVTQAQVTKDGVTKTFDVKFDVTLGTVASNGDWVKLNNGTKLTVPSCKDAVIEFRSHGAGTVTANGDATTETDGTNHIFQYTATAEGNVVLEFVPTTDVTHYIKYLKVTLPVPSAPAVEIPTFSLTEEQTVISTKTPDGWTAVQLPQIPEITESNATIVSGLVAEVDNTAAIQAALDAVPAEGGMVVVPAGTWISGPLTVKSKTVLHLKAGATQKLLPYGNGADGKTASPAGYYPTNGTNKDGMFNYKMFLTCADNATDIVVEGEGDGSIIDGQGALWWDKRDVLGTRPPLIRFQKGSRFLFRNFKLQNSPGTNLTLGNSGKASHFTVHDVTISNPSSESDQLQQGEVVSHNTDGIPVWGPYVNIYDCNISTGDDNIVADSDAHHLHAWNINCGYGHGMSIGSYTERLHDVIYEDITFTNTTAGFRIKTNNDRSGNDQAGTNDNGAVKNIICRNATMTGVPGPIKITSWYDDDVQDPSTVSTPSAIVTKTPEFCNITFQNITADAVAGKTSWKHNTPIYIYGRPEMKIHDITFDNVQIESKRGMFLAYCEGINFTNGCEITNETTATEFISVQHAATVTGNYGQMHTSDLTAVTATKQLEVGSTLTLAKPTNYTTSGTGAVTFSSDNTEVATVNSTTGEITAVAAGTAKITITQVADENYDGGSAEITVTVIPAVEKETVKLIDFEGKATEYSELPTGVTIEGTTIMSKKVQVKGSDYYAIQLANGYTATDKSYNGNDIKLSVEGGFKAGDVITIVGYINNKDNTKKGKIDLFTLGDENAITKIWSPDGDTFNNTYDTSVEPSEVRYTLEADADVLYIGRNGGTGTNIAKILVTREVPVDPSDDPDPDPEPVGDEELFKATATTEYSVPASTTEPASLESYATITGGQMYVISAQGDAKKLVTTSSFAMTNGNTFFKVTLPKALQAKDVITVKIKQNASASRGIWLHEYVEENAYPSGEEGIKIMTVGTGSAFEDCTYKIKAGDYLIGKTEFYIYRATGNGTDFQDFTITRPAPRTFVDFKVNLRTDPYTMIEPAALPTGVSITGSFHDTQHGYNSSTIVIPVDGAVKLTFGACKHGTTTATIKDGTGTVIGTVNCSTDACDSDTSYDKKVVWTYNNETPTTLTITTPSYCPFFYAEACEYLPQVTVTYYDADGTSVIGTDVVNGSSALTYKYNKDDVTVATGTKFRNWKNSEGVVVAEGTTLNADLNLYACVTDIEVATKNSEHTYNLTDSKFLVDEHELISVTNGSFHDGQHGWAFSNGGKVTLSLAGNATITVGNCVYPQNGTTKIVAKNAADEAFGECNAVVASDGATHTFIYEGGAGDVTLNITGGEAYIHSIKITHTGDLTLPVWSDEKEAYTFTTKSDAATNAKELLYAISYVNTQTEHAKKLWIPNGTYDLGTAHNTSIPAGMHLIGESQDSVLIKNQPTEESINATATFQIDGANVTLENMTIKCRAPYTTGDGHNAERGVCVEDCGNGSYYINVTLDGLQDTYYSNGAAGMKATFDNCIVRGNVDFFCGNGDITVNNSRLQIVTTHTSGGTAIICAPATYTNGETQGYQFNNCIVEAATSEVGCLVSGHSTNLKFNLARAWYAGGSTTMGLDRTPRVTFTDTDFEIKQAADWGGSIGYAQAEERRVFNIVNTGVQFSDEAMVIDKTNKPFAYATANDRTDPTKVSASNITGGGEYDLETIMEKMEAGDGYTVGTTKTIDGHKAIVLRSANTVDSETKKETRVPMDDAILNAIKANDIIVLDGSGASTDFVLSQYIRLSGVKDKTIVGINGARLCTEWYLTDYFKSLLENVPTSSGTGVNSASTAEGTGGSIEIIRNGQPYTDNIKEEGEYLTRKTLLEATGDKEEKYRNAGIFYIDHSSNLIIRNFKFVGPGSLDCAGYDLMAIIDDTHHCWIDHCEFIDGMDGNFDITNRSDFVTVSWCQFRYTDRSYAHQNTNLVGSSDDKTDDRNKLNITFAYNEWGANCRARMPMARFGRIHMLNNYYNCAGNSEYAMNPRKESEFLVQGNYWERGVRRTFTQKSASAITWDSNNYYADNAAGEKGESFGTTVTVPYQYSSIMLDPHKVPEVITLNGGAKLYQKPYFTANLGVADNTPGTPELQHNATLNEELKKDGLVFSVWAENAHTFQWYKQDVTLDGTAGEWEMIEGENRNTYTFKPVTGVEFNLKCQAFGVSGETTSDILKVKIDGLAAPYYLGGMPTEMQTVYTGSPMTFTANFKDATGYQWYKNTTEEIVVDDAHKIEDATYNTYTYDPATAEIFYLYCVASNSNGKGDGYSDIVKVKGIYRDVKFHYYGNYNYEAHRSEEVVEGGTGGLYPNTEPSQSTFHTDCTTETTKCTASLNSIGTDALHDKVSGLRFENKDTHTTETFFADNTYVLFNLNNALVAGQTVRLSGFTGKTDSPNEKFGFYVCTSATKTADNTVATLKLTQKKNTLEYAEAIVPASCAGAEKLYVIPFVDKAGRDITLHDLMVYAGETVPADDPTVTVETESPVSAKVGNEVVVRITATDAQSYQWYKNSTEELVFDEEHKIAGQTNANLSYTPEAEGTEYVYCRVIGKKADTHVDTPIIQLNISEASASQSGTLAVTWPLVDNSNKYTAVPAATLTGDITIENDVLSSMDNAAVGSKLTQNGVLAAQFTDDKTTKFYANYKPTTSENLTTDNLVVDENAYVKFTFTPKVSFKPTKVSFLATINGTGNGGFQPVLVYGSGAEEKVNLSNSTTFKRDTGIKSTETKYECLISDLTINPSTPVTIYLYVGGKIASNRNVLFKDVKIEGEYIKEELTQCLTPSVVKGNWDAEHQQWEYTLACAQPETAKIHYKIGDADAVEAPTNPVTIKVSEDVAFSVWASDPETDPDAKLKDSKTVEMTGDVRPQLAAPSILFATYNVAVPAERGFLVTLTDNNDDVDNVTLHYTIDGSEPTTESAAYSAPFLVGGDVTVKAIATKTNYASSKEESAKTLPVNSEGSETTTNKNTNNHYSTVGENVGFAYTYNDNDKTVQNANKLSDGLKFTTNAALSIDDKTGFAIKVNPGFVITKVVATKATTNNDAGTMTFGDVYVDGEKNGTLDKKLPYYGGSNDANAITFTVAENIAAKEKIEVVVTSSDVKNNQANVLFTVFYEFDDAPTGVTITDSKNSEDVITLNETEMTSFMSSHEYTVNVEKMYAEDPIVKITTEKGYEYIVPAGDIETDGDKLTHFTKSFVGVEYTVKAKVNAVKSPNIEIANEMSLKGGYKVTLTYSKEDGIYPYINVDNTGWVAYDPEKEYFALGTVQSKMKYGSEQSLQTVAREASCPSNSYKAGKPFAVYLYVNGYQDGQVGAQIYNQNSFEKEGDKIYAAIANQFNVIPLAVNNSDAILEKRPDINDAKLVVITETLGGSGSVEIPGVGNKSNMMALTLKRDVLDKTNVLNLKMFLNSSSSANNQRWQWAQPRAMASELTSIMPCTPDGGGMYEIFGNATMSRDASINLWDNVSTENMLYHLQPVFNFNDENENRPNFTPLALVIDPEEPEDQREEYHAIHFYEKNGFQYVAFGLSINEWKQYNDNVYAIIDKIGEMIKDGKDLDSKLTGIVKPTITDNGDGSANVFNNNPNADTYYVVYTEDVATGQSFVQPTADYIITNGMKANDTDFHTQKYTEKMYIFAVSKLGVDAVSVVVEDSVKGNSIRYVIRENDDPAAQGMVAKYPFDLTVNSGTFNMPYNQSWKKDGYTVTEWEVVNETSGASTSSGTSITRGSIIKPGETISGLTQDITVKAIWSENTKMITDLGKNEDKAHRTVTWEFLQSKGAPALAMESKAGNMQAILVGQVHFNVYDEEGHKTGEEFIDVPMTINTDNLATLPDNGTEYHGKFNNTSTNWAKALTDGDKEYTGSDYAQVRTGTQFTFPAVYGMNVVYKQIDLVEATNGTANGNVNRSQVSQSYLTDGTKTADVLNTWRFVNPGFQLDANGKVVMDNGVAQLAKTSAMYEQFKAKGQALGLYDEVNGGNDKSGGLIYYQGEGTEATLTSMESAQYVHVGATTGKPLGGLNYGSVFMQSLSVTYPELYDLEYTVVAVGNTDPENSTKSEYDPNDELAKIEFFSNTHKNAAGRYFLGDKVKMKFTPAYGYEVKAEDDVPSDPSDPSDPSYIFIKNGAAAFAQDGMAVQRYLSLDADGKTANDAKAIEAEDRIPSDGAIVDFKMTDLNLTFSVKKLPAVKYNVEAYPSTLGYITFNTGNGRPHEDEYKEFPVGKTIYITAHPNTGYKFKEWRRNSGDGEILVSQAEYDALPVDGRSGYMVLPAGVTKGDGVMQNPFDPTDFLERDEMMFTVSEANNDFTYVAVFEKGKTGTAHYEFDHALLQTYAGQPHATMTKLEITAEDKNKFPTEASSKALNIPYYYTLFKPGYTLDHWVEIEEEHETNEQTHTPADHDYGKSYRIGTFYYYETVGEVKHLVPVFTKNTTSYDYRATPVDITWDLRVAENAQRMTFKPGVDGTTATTKIYYSTHAKINNGVLIDVPLTITLGKKGKLINDIEEEDKWCAMGEGTTIQIPSGLGAKFTIASLSKMETTTIDGVVPTSYTEETIDDAKVYLYTFTTQSEATSVTLKIGDDYTYYKYIRAELPAADAVPLTVTVNNDAFGTVDIAAARTTADVADNETLLNKINATKTPIQSRALNSGHQYTLGLGTIVSLHAKRSHLYVLDYFEDGDGNRYSFKADSLCVTDMDGNDITTAAKAVDEYLKMEKVQDFNTVTSLNDLQLTFQVQSYSESMHAVYKENTLYQVNYTSGEEAEGEAPGMTLVEDGEAFTIPAQNHHLYLDGQTLRYWIDEDGNKYDLGQSYTTNKDLFLSPVFKVNDFTVMNLDAPATATWPLSRQLNDGIVINFEGINGIYVTPLEVKDGEGNVVDFIDLKMDIRGENGKANNVNSTDRCQINTGTVFGLPSSSNCTFTLKSANSSISAKIDGTAVEGQQSVSSDYTGDKTQIDVQFTGNTYLYEVVAEYKPVTTKLPELDYATVGNISLGALGTPLAGVKLSTLKKAGEVSGVPADLSNSTTGIMPVVRGTATRGGYVDVIQATIDNPVATMLVKTRDGVTVSVYKIGFDVTYPDIAPRVTDLKIDRKFQCDLKKMYEKAIEDTRVDGTNYINDNAYLKHLGVDGETKEKADMERVAINGVINIKFSTKMAETTLPDTTFQANNGKATLGQAVYALEGQTLTFTYKGLKTNTEYDFIIPAGTFKDVFWADAAVKTNHVYNEPIRIHFTTVETAISTERRVINYVVTHNQASHFDVATAKMVADGAPVKVASDELIANLEDADIPYGTLDEGVKLANAYKEAGKRFYIFVPDGEYQLMGNDSVKSVSSPIGEDGKVISALDGKTNVYSGITTVSRDNVSITGQSQEKTIVYNHPVFEGLSNAATLKLNGGIANFYAQDMTLQNRFDFLRCRKVASKGVAPALWDRSAKPIFKNVKFDSYQDTYYTNANNQLDDTRGYAEDCTIMGYVDFICGDGDHWFQNCDMVVRQGVGSTATNMFAPRQYDTQKWGYVMKKCTFSAENNTAFDVNNGKMTIARPWANSPAETLIECKYDVLSTDDGYKKMTGGGLIMRMQEYKSYDSNGSILDLSKRSLRNSTPGIGSYDAVMTPSKAAEYNLFDVMGGEDGYDPTLYTAQVNMDDKEIKQDDTSLTWDDKSEALCYFLFVSDTENGDYKLFTITDETTFDVDGQNGKWFIVRAANQRGGLGEPTKPKLYEAVDSYKRQLTNNNQVVNDMDGIGWRWSTIYLDFNAKAPTDTWFNRVTGKEEPAIYVYAVTQVNASNLLLKRVKVMEKNCGYIIKAIPRDEDYVFKYTETPAVYFDGEGEMTLSTYVSKKKEYLASKDQTADFNLSRHSLLDGTVKTDGASPAGISSAGVNAFTLSNKIGLGFYKYNGTRLNQYYAWLDASLVAAAQDKEAQGGSSSSSSADSKCMRFIIEEDFDNLTTEIQGVMEESESLDDHIYNLNGQRINASQMQRGQIYIINGKKIRK